jgi:putative transposase
MLKRENLVVNHKRTERIYREERLALRRKRRRKGAAGVRVMIPAAVRRNEQWSMDFVSDSIVTGRKFRALTIVECNGRILMTGDTKNGVWSAEDNRAIKW